MEMFDLKKKGNHYKVSSFDVARFFGKKHDRILKLVDQYRADLESIKKHSNKALVHAVAYSNDDSARGAIDAPKMALKRTSRLRPSYVIDDDQTEQMFYWLTKQDCDNILMNLTDEKARMMKILFVRQFHLLEKKMIEKRAGELAKQRVVKPRKMRFVVPKGGNQRNPESWEMVSKYLHEMNESDISYYKDTTARRVAYFAIQKLIKRTDDKTQSELLHHLIKAFETLHRSRFTFQLGKKIKIKVQQ